MCIQSNFKYTQYIKWKVERKSPIRQEAGLIIDAFQLIPKLNEHNLLFASAWLCILERLKYKKTVKAHDSTWFKTLISHFYLAIC